MSTDVLLTSPYLLCIPIYNMERSYSTAEVAKAIDVSKGTLLRWLQTGQLEEPKRETTFGGVESRVWSEADLARAKEFRAGRFRKRT